LSIRLAHLSDVHLAPLPLGSLFGDFALKRLLGGLNWKLRRHRWHERAIADAMVDDIRSHKPDHVALTGDIINLSSHAEFRQAAMWLQSFGPPDWISFVPGNHDAYVPVPWEQGLLHFAPYMAGSMVVDHAFTSLHNAQPFPYVRFRGSVALVGLTTALPQPIGKATGLLGATQLKALRPLLRNLRQKGCFRLLMIHHPPVPGHTPPSKALTDAGEFADVIAAEGAELILHGHIHRNSRTELACPGRSVPVLGVAAASMVASDKREAASWNLIEISRQGGSWRTQVTVRTYDSRLSSFATVSQMPLP
jgi:3',5'-cyclic AMP phosphodiesterase CpdA